MEVLALCVPLTVFSLDQWWFPGMAEMVPRYRWAVVICKLTLVMHKSSQNHRMVEVGRNLWRLFGSSPSCQAWPFRAVCPGKCPDDFWISAKMETAQTRWASVSDLHNRNMISHVQRELSVFQFVPSASGSDSKHHEESLSPASLHSPFRCNLYTFM